jgi:hypothetical protein
MLPSLAYIVMMEFISCDITIRNCLFVPEQEEFNAVENGH